MKKVLVVIDCQNDFITGSLRNEEAIKAVPNVVKKIREFKGDLIVATLDTHDEDYLETKEGAKLPVVHCVKGSDGWKIEDNVQAALNDAKLRNITVSYVEKPTFGTEKVVKTIKDNTRLSDELDIEFIGFCTDICVVSNTLLTKAAFYDRATVRVDASACAGVTPDTHSAALTTMKMCQIDVENE